MKLKMYSVYDKKSTTYDIPLFFRNESVLKRMFLRLYSNQSAHQSDMAKFPEDYVVHEIGTFNQETSETITTPPRAVFELATIASQAYQSLQDPRQMIIPGTQPEISTEENANNEE